MKCERYVGTSRIEKAHTHVHTRTHTHTHKRTHAYTHTCTHVHFYVRAYTYAREYTQTRACCSRSEKHTHVQVTRLSPHFKLLFYLYKR